MDREKLSKVALFGWFRMAWSGLIKCEGKRWGKREGEMLPNKLMLIVFLVFFGWFRLAWPGLIKCEGKRWGMREGEMVPNKSVHFPLEVAVLG